MRPLFPTRLPLQLDLFPPEAVNRPEPGPPASSSPAVPPDTCAGKSFHTGAFRTISLNDRILTYFFRRSRRRTIGFSIGQSGLSVTAPQRTSMRDIETAIQKKARWITGKLDYFLHQVPDVSPFYPADGTPLPYLGYTLTLRLIPAETDEIRLHEKTRELFVHFRASSEQLVERIISWLREEAARILAMRVRHYASVMHMETPPLTLSSARRCWGSCSRNGHIRLNWRLVHCAPRQIDYVIVHELAHTKEMNHSKHFWRIVSEVFPDYAAVRKELNGQGARLLSLF